MHRLVISDAGVMRLAIQQEIARSEESRYDHRLHGCCWSAWAQPYQVADWFGQDPGRWRAGSTASSAGASPASRSAPGPAGRPASPPAKWRRWTGRSGERRGPGVQPNPLGWQAPGAPCGRAVRRGLGGPAVPAALPPAGVPAAQARPVIAQADPAAQAAFKKTPPPRRRPAVDLWSVDECHFQQHGTRCAMWVPLRRPIRSCSTPPPARPWPSSGRCSRPPGASAPALRPSSMSAPSSRSWASSYATAPGAPPGGHPG